MIFAIISPVYWFKFKKALEKSFSDPTLVLFILLILLVLSWKILPKKWHRYSKVVISALGLAYFILYSPIGAFLMVKGLASPLPQSAEVTTDTIVLLGRGGSWADEQIQIATQLWQANHDSQIFISGNSIEAEILSAGLLEAGIPPEQISGERCSRTTEDNARFTAAVLSEEPGHHIALITDKPHMLRSLLTFQSFGFQVSPHPVELPEDMGSFRVSRLALREYVALMSYASLGRFRQRSDVELQKPTDCLIEAELNNTTSSE